MTQYDLNLHEKKILNGLVQFYLNGGYKSDEYNDPEHGGLYEHKLAKTLGYINDKDGNPPKEFEIAAKVLEEKGFVKRMKRKEDFHILGIWPTTSGIVKSQEELSKDESPEKNILPLNKNNYQIIKVKLKAIDIYYNNVAYFNLDVTNDDESREEFEQMYNDVKLTLNDPDFEKYAPPLPHDGSYGHRQKLIRRSQLLILDRCKKLLIYVGGLIDIYENQQKSNLTEQKKGLEF